MNNEVFLKISGAIITIAVTLITGFLIPWLKSKISQTQLEKLDYYLKLAVRCANQIYTPEQYVQKKEYVLKYITDICNNTFNLSLSALDIDTLIEGTVNEIKKETL